MLLRQQNFAIHQATSTQDLIVPVPADPLSILKTIYGYDAFRGQQREIIEHVISGHNAFVLMPTGGGKSLCYQIPALVRPGIGLVVSPLIALMEDQVAALRQAGVKASALNSQLWGAEKDLLWRDIERGELDMLFVNPQSTNSATQRLADAAKAHNVPVVEIRETPPAGQNFLDYFEEIVGQITDIAAHAEPTGHHH